jgi:hypothetical protein
MFRFGRSRELIVKYSQLKHAKRVSSIWNSYLAGVLQKASTSMQAL